MNNAILAAMLGDWEFRFSLDLLALLVMTAVVGGVVFLVVWLASRGQIPKSSPPPFPNPPQRPTTQPVTATCPRCGAALPANAPQGLCPRCVLGVGLATQTELTGEEVVPDETKKVPTTSQSPLTPEEIAQHFPQFHILECLGRGGMGVVYKAVQKSLDRVVALKILAPEREQDPQFSGRFAREAKTLAQLSHPNIVTVHDFGEADGMFYLVMEFVDGVSLRQLLRDRRLAPEEALAIVPPVCEALQYAHNRGVVHRDIKPENLLLDKQGRIKIADFGIAKLMGAKSAPPFVVPPSGGSDAPNPDRLKPGLQAGLTDASKIVGTPTYMAPEQREHPTQVDHRADIYSLGVVLYEMLTGELPTGKFQPPSRKVQVDVRIDEIVLRALEQEPERRYQTATQFKTQVETIAAASSLASAKSEAAPELVSQDAGRKTGFIDWAWRALVLVMVLYLFFSSPRTGKAWNYFNTCIAILALVTLLDMLWRYRGAGKIKTGETTRDPAHRPTFGFGRSGLAGCWGKIVLVGVKGGIRVIQWFNVVAVFLFMVFAGVGGSMAFSVLRDQPAVFPPDIVQVLPWVLIAFVFVALPVSEALKQPTFRLIDLDENQASLASKPGIFWSPIMSPEAREICGHLTKAERGASAFYGLLYGVWNVVALFGPVALIRHFPGPGSWIVAALIVLIYIICIPKSLQIQRQFLSSTAWARERGLQPDQLKLFSFSERHIWKATVVVVILGILLLAIAS